MRLVTGSTKQLVLTGHSGLFDTLARRFTGWRPVGTPRTGLFGQRRSGA